MTIQLERYLVRVPLIVDVQIDAVDGETAQRLVNRSMADGALNNMKLRITPVRGKAFAGGRIVRARPSAQAAIVDS
jgi:hypothetical protein